jgi:hypothetical protein
VEVVSAPARQPWGYVGTFADPDGRLWMVTAEACTREVQQGVPVLSWPAPRLAELPRPVPQDDPYETRAADWAPMLLEGMDVDDIMLWITSRALVQPGDAAALHRAGVRPDETGWSYEDRGDATLAERLLNRRWTVEQVVTEVEARRQRSG